MRKLTEEECAALTSEEKLRKYQGGEYVFLPPPVSCSRWDDAAWIRYIDGKEGAWTNGKP